MLPRGCVPDGAGVTGGWTLKSTDLDSESDVNKKTALVSPRSETTLSFPKHSSDALLAGKDF